MCFLSGQSWGDVEQLWSKHKVGTSKQLQAWARKLSPLLRSLAWVQCVQRGFGLELLCPTAPSGRGQSVWKEHSGDPQIAVLANNWPPAGWQKDEGEDPTGLG